MLTLFSRLKIYIIKTDFSGLIMKNLSSSNKFSWKRVGLGFLAGIFILFLGCLVYYYFAVYRPEQELLRAHNRFLEYERQFYERKGLPLPQD